MECREQKKVVSRLFFLSLGMRDEAGLMVRTHHVLDSRQFPISNAQNSENRTQAPWTRLDVFWCSPMFSEDLLSMTVAVTKDGITNPTVPVFCKYSGSCLFPMGLIGYPPQFKQNLPKVKTCQKHLVVGFPDFACVGTGISSEGTGMAEGPLYFNLKFTLPSPGLRQLYIFRFFAENMFFPTNWLAKTGFSGPPKSVYYPEILFIICSTDNEGFHWLTGTKLFKRLVDILTFG